MAQVDIIEAARIVGLTVDQLKISRQRGLPPGALGYIHEGRLLFDTERLQAAPLTSRKAKVRTMAEALPEPQPAPLEVYGPYAAELEPALICPDCGFQAKSKAGLTMHRKTHAA